MNMKKTRMIAVFLLAAMLTGCGSAAPNIAPSQTEPAARTEETTQITAETKTESGTEPETEEHSKTETTAAETKATEAKTAATTAAASATTAAATQKPTAATTDKNRDAEFAWFGKGVYKVTVNGSETGEYYIFTDKSNGKTSNAKTEIGIGFTCEQNKNSVTFHMGQADDNSVMTMGGPDANGNITGTMNGRTYSFALLNGVSPDGFDAAAYEKGQSAGSGEDGQNPIMNFIGTYSNGRAIITVSGQGSQDAAVNVKWGSSAFVSSEWNMSGKVTEEGGKVIITYSNCIMKTVIYSEDGVLKEDKTDYENGSGKFIFSGNQVVWEDMQDHIGDDQDFRYSN